MIVPRLLLILLLCGGSAMAAEPVTLRAGRVSLVFEPDNAFVRYVRVGNHKILQGISAPVRDEFWGTVPPNVTNVRVQQDKQSFTLMFDVACRQGTIDFSWEGRIAGNAQGNLTFTFDGEAHSDFLRNRIGFCVLHGPEAAGKPCRLETVDGQMQLGRFPDFIAPHQPFKNLRTISHELADGVWARVRMEGDTFETEDQRNWTDASFKTYCTPLELPYPVKIAKGTRVSQRIEILLEGLPMLREQPQAAGGPVVLQVAGDDNAKQRLPGIGLRVSSQADQLTDTEVERLRELHLDHLRVDITPATPSSNAKLRSAAEQARRLGIALHVGLHPGASAAGELDSLAAVLQEIPSPAVWLLISANESQVRIAREFLSRTGQKGRLGRGEDSNFTELNRQRPDPATIDLVSYGLNPQIHAFDNTSIVETLAIQGDTVRSARQFAGSRPLLVSPITLKSQTRDERLPAGQLPRSVDLRQTSPFAAGWTLGSIKYLAEAGVDRATYYETIGWLGIMEAESGTPLPDRFPSQPGQLFPIYHLLRELAPLAGGQVRTTSSSDPMAVIGLAVEREGWRRVLLANLTSAEQTARVLGCGDRIAVRRLGEQDVAFTADLLTLPPYGITVLEPQ